MITPVSPRAAGAGLFRLGASIVATLGMLVSACSAKSPPPSPAGVASLRWTDSTKPRSLAAYPKVIVEEFKERVTDRYQRVPLDQAASKKDEMRGAMRQVPDQLAEALSQTHTFEHVARVGDPDPHTLVIAGTLVRYDEGDSDVRRTSRARFGGAQFEAQLELRDGGDGRVLAKVIEENTSTGGAGVRSTEGLAMAVERGCQRMAAAIAGAR